MKIAFHIGDPSIPGDARFKALSEALRSGGAEFYPAASREDILPGTSMVLSIGGDGTFLGTTRIVAEAGIPILGVNFGRLGFLSENKPERVAAPILEGSYTIKERAMLQVSSSSPVSGEFWPYALNEAGVYRSGADTIGIQASVGGMELPTYWADGLMAATSSGSTAYNLSAGGPICLPDAEVLLLTPVAPHNLGLRPLVVPVGKTITMKGNSRSGRLSLSLDNRRHEIPSGTEISISTAPFRLRLVDLGQENFIDALRIRLFWGQDVRNMHV